MAGRYQKQAVAAAGENSTPIIFPRRVDEATVKAIPGSGGSATVQFTLDDPDLVRLLPDTCDWENWEPGSVSATTSRALAGPVTALRIAAVGQQATLQVAGSFDF